MTMTPEQVTPPLCEHGEGVMVSPRWVGPRWVDMLAGDVLELQPSGEVRRRNVGTVAAFIRPRAGRGWVVALEREIARANDDDLDAPLAPDPELWTDPSVRSNEGACSPDGTLLLGTMAYSAAPGAGFVLAVDPAGRGSRVVDDVTISNGLAFTPDARFAYYVDSPLRRVDRFEWSTERGLYNRRAWGSLPGTVRGIPDGLAVDCVGGVWVAVFGGSCVVRFDSEGEVDEVVPLPVSQPTAVAFEGESLLVTTSRYGLGESAEVAAGALFRIPEVGIAGAPIASFRG